MKRFLLILLSFSLFSVSGFSQTYKTREGVVYFNPNKNQENKEYAAMSKEATALLKIDNSEVALLVPMKSFHFGNALLEEHFNENYLHTNKYPNGTYKGKLIGFKKEMLEKDGTYSIASEGQMDLHGVTRNFSAPVTLIVKGKTVTFKCNFNVKAEDYKIDIPGLVKPKLSENTPLESTILFKIN